MKISTENGKKRKRAEWQETLVIVWETLKTGPKYPHEIYGVVKQRLGKKSRRLRTAERVLESLSEMGLVEKRDDGRYYLMSEAERVESPEEYKIRLNHSQTLLSHYKNTGDLQSLLDNRFFMEHIESGYPDINKLITEWRECQNKLKGLKDMFEAILMRESEKTGISPKILERALEKALKMENPTVEELSEILSLNNFFDLIALEIKFGSEKVGPRKGHWSDLTPDYLLKLRNETKEIYQNINNTERECKQLQSKLRDCLGKLVSRVYHGTPLEGYCQMCPKVKIENE